MTAQTAIVESPPTFDEVLEIVQRIGIEVITPHADDVDSKARFPTEAFDALKAERLLSAYIPNEYGGMELSIRQICKICEKLGAYCASTAMIYAMHQIQIASIVQHGQNSSYFKRYLSELVRHQYLLASATTELGVGGDVRSSICAVQVEGDMFSLEKQAPVISYGLHADAILVTCRKADDAPASEQVLVLVHKNECELEQIADWDTLGFRGTCSLGFKLSSRGSAEQILPKPYAQILSQSMHPVSHLVWGSLWFGLASDAVNKARATVRAAARKSPDHPPLSAMRLTEVEEMLFSMRSGLYLALDEYERLLAAGDAQAFANFGFATRINNVKLRCSELVVEIVGKALLIVGIAGYKNNSGNSLCRHVRDAYGAALMVNNDRIRGHNSTMQMVYQED